MAKKSTKQSTGKSLSEFRERYDKDYIMPTRIRAALKELGESWESEMEFSRRADVSLSNLNIYRQEFEGHVVVVDRKNKRVWCGTVELANQCREMV